MITETHRPKCVRSKKQVVLVSLLFGTLCGCGPMLNKSMIDDAEGDAAFAMGAQRPPAAKTLFGLARILAAQGRDREAANVLARATKEFPEFLPAYSELAELHMRNQRPDEAIRVLHAGITVSPREPTFVNNLGMCLCFKGEYQLALEMFTKAAAIAPDDGRYRANIAMALGMLRRYEESLATYKQIVSNYDAHYNLGVLYEANEEYSNAIKEYERAAALRQSTIGR